jgi:DNA-binding transcriptional LysR family regulator
VRLGIVPTAAQYLLPAALRSLMARAPQVAVSTTVGLRESLTGRLRSGELDLMVVSEHRVTNPEFASGQVAEDRIVVVASPSHPLCRGPAAANRLRVRDLAPYDWVLQEPGSPTREWIEAAFERLGQPPPRVRFESDMLLMLPALMAGTELLGFVSRLHLHDGGRGIGLRELPVAGLTMRRRFVASWRKSAYVPPAARLLVRLLTEAGSGMPL